MSFMESIRTCFTKYVDFTGRARRSEYWWFVLLNSLVSSALARLSQIGGGSTFFEAIASLWSLAVLLPGIAVAVRRLHDVGKSGWNYLWILLPIVGWILLLVYMVRPGLSGTNQYGEDPKDPYAGSFRDERPPWEN